jgi:hypothetical protein
MKWLKDLFYGPDNQALELGRVIAFFATFSMLLGALWNVLLGLPLELGPTGLGGGLAAVLGGAAALIYAKDRAKSERTVANAVSDATPSAGATPAQSAAKK